MVSWETEGKAPVSAVDNSEESANDHRRAPTRISGSVGRRPKQSYAHLTRKSGQSFRLGLRANAFSQAEELRNEIPH